MKEGVENGREGGKKKVVGESLILKELRYDMHDHKSYNQCTKLLGTGKSSRTEDYFKKNNIKNCSSRE